MKNYKMVESMLKQDFERAKGRHDFKEMRDNYELLRELWSTGELDAEEYCDEESRIIVHFFSEIEDNKITLPQNIKWCSRNYGKKVIYSLEPDGIKIIFDNNDKRIFEYFSDEGIETKYIILKNVIRLNCLAKKTLHIHNKDIVEICIDEDMISIFRQ